MTLKAKRTPTSTSNERLWEQVKLSLACLHTEIPLTYDFGEEPLYDLYVSRLLQSRL